MHEIVEIFLEKDQIIISFFHVIFVCPGQFIQTGAHCTAQNRYEYLKMYVECDN